MPTLAETFTAPTKRPIIISDCCTLIDEEVDSKGGISGFAIKGGYKLVKGFKPGFIPEVVESLLPDFCTAVQPIVDDAQKQGRPVGQFFSANRDRVAEALLAITDERARRTRHGAVKSMYEKLRGLAKKNVEEAVPRVGALIQKHAS
jgi:hypothetical protein